MAEALKTQGNAAFKEGRYDQAVDYFTAAIDLDNTNAVRAQSHGWRGPG